MHEHSTDEIRTPTRFTLHVSGSMQVRQASSIPTQPCLRWRQALSTSDTVIALTLVAALFTGVFFYGPMVLVLVLMVMAALVALGLAVMLWIRAVT